jgi:hypothetical protein
VDPAGHREEDRVTPCTATTGFFVLGHCGRAAVTGCGRCGRAICAEHADPRGLCPECAGALGYADPYGPSWARGYRRTYYQQTSYDYGDPGWYSSFDDHDRGGFESGGDDGFDIGGDVGGDDGGWVDS